MSRATSRSVRLGVIVFVAAILQAVYAGYLSLGGAHPDFVTTAVILAAMFCGANGGAGLGFLGGLLLASLASPPAGGFGSLVVSRALVGAVIGWMEERVYRDNILIAILLVAVGTASAGGLLFVFDPQPSVARWGRALLGMAAYNAVIAGPVYMVMRRLAGIGTDSTASLPVR